MYKGSEETEGFSLVGRDAQRVIRSTAVLHLGGVDLLLLTS